MGSSPYSVWVSCPTRHEMLVINCNASYLLLSVGAFLINDYYLYFSWVIIVCNFDLKQFLHKFDCVNFFPTRKVFVFFFCLDGIFYNK